MDDANIYITDYNICNYALLLGIKFSSFINYSVNRGVRDELYFLFHFYFDKTTIEYYST